VAVEIVQLVEEPRLLLGIVEVGGGVVSPASGALREDCALLAQRLADPGYELPEADRRAVRSLLKTGGYSPTGRGKPAHEFLLGDLKERGSFNHISAPVDVNNLLSLELMLPISLLDADKVGDVLTVRIGQPDEGYVFNPSGQWLDVKRCILLAGGPPPGAPLGTPVKDSMLGKVFDGATRFLGVIYATTELYDEAALQAATRRFAELLARESGGSLVQARVI
jgi:DNA/RNA-binding domain of Phe-tRNA-synthetase-like protein